MSDSENLRTPDSDDRRLDLVIQNATTGLTTAELSELRGFLSFADSRSEAELEIEQLELAAAAFDMCLANQSSAVVPRELPGALRDQLLIEAGQFFASEAMPDVPASSSKVADPLKTAPAGDSINNASLPGSTESMNNRSKMSPREWLLLAALAASLLLWLGSQSSLWNRDVPIAAATPAERLSELLGSKPADLIALDWQPVHSPNASGRVIWSDSQQTGFLEFSGMDVNDPAVSQYQLWIFDTDPAQATPIDGGVFDITASNKTVVIPIRATVPVGRAVQFAVTVEKPGGVYVSKREKIPVLATLAAKE